MCTNAEWWQNSCSNTQLFPILFIHELPNSVRLYFLNRYNPQNISFAGEAKKKKNFSELSSLLQMNFLQHRNETICNKEERFLKSGFLLLL